MKRNKVYAITLPILAGLALVGSGFSVWYFTDGALSQNIEDISVQIDPYAEIGNLTVKNLGDKELHLHLDSPDDQGIHIHDEEHTVFDDIDLTYTYYVSSETSLDKQITFTAVVQTSTALDSYLNLTTSNYDYDSGATTFTLTQTLTPTGTTAGKEATIDIDLDPLAFEYREDKNPVDAASWEEMNTNLTSSTISITYSIEWTD